MYGTQGNFEGAYTIVRNRAAQLGADYVQILRTTGPHMEGLCMSQAFVIDALAFRRASRSDGAPSVAATTAARTPGLGGTYSGELVGQAQGQPFRTRITFTVVQSGTELVGTFTTAAGTTGTIKGTAVEAVVRECSARQLEPCLGEYVGRATIQDGGGRLSGSDVGRDCAGALTASFEVARRE